MNNFIHNSAFRIVPSFFFLAWLALAGCNPGGSAGDTAENISEIFTEKARGCGNFFVFKHDALFTNFLVVHGDTQSLLTDTTQVVFDLETTPGLTLYLDEYGFDDGTEYAGCFHYCNDVICSDVNEMLTDNLDRWSAEKGVIEMKRSTIDTTGFFNTYQLDVVIREAELQFENQTLILENIVFESVPVGWLPG